LRCVGGLKLSNEYTNVILNSETSDHSKQELKIFHFGNV